MVTFIYWQHFFGTFEMLPMGTFKFDIIAMTEFIKICGKLFYVAIQMALPILIVLFIIDFSLGITNKVSPQINVLELNFAMKPTTGMLILLILMSSIVSMMSEYTGDMVKDSLSAIRAIAKKPSQ